MGIAAHSRIGIYERSVVCCLPVLSVCPFWHACLQWPFSWQDAHHKPMSMCRPASRIRQSNHILYDDQITQASVVALDPATGAARWHIPVPKGALAISIVAASNDTLYALPLLTSSATLQLLALNSAVGNGNAYGLILPFSPASWGTSQVGTSIVVAFAGRSGQQIWQFPVTAFATDVMVA